MNEPLIQLAISVVTLLGIIVLGLTQAASKFSTSKKDGGGNGVAARLANVENRVDKSEDNFNVFRDGCTERHMKLSEESGSDKTTFEFIKGQLTVILSEVRNGKEKQ